MTIEASRPICDESWPPMRLEGARERMQLPAARVIPR
jgi:hypothetical protein